MEEKRRSLAPRGVSVIADWDADGATSAAMIVYAQEHRHLYPLRGRHSVEAYPSGPRGFPDALREACTPECPEALVVLDIPFTERVYASLKAMEKRCGSTRVIYIDHHYSSLYAVNRLQELTEEVYLGHKPTAILTYNILASLGLRKLTPRLAAFMKAVGVLEKSRKPTPGEVRIIRLAASISKASTVLRDRELWLRLVRWLASPLPAGTPVDMKVIRRVLEVAEKTDKEIEERAKELAFSARRVGFIKFVDARGRWRGRGASALASKLFKILHQPVALLVRRDDGAELLIIRTRGVKAYRIAVGLLRQGLADNIGGHSSLAVVKLVQGVDMGRLEEALRRLSFKAERAGDEDVF